MDIETQTMAQAVAAALCGQWAAITPCLVSAPRSQYLWKYLEQQRLCGPFLAAHARATDAPELRSPLRGQLSGYQTYQRTRAEKVLRSAERLSVALADSDIPHALLKGLHLSQRLYGDLETRFVWDLDLLVPAQDVAAASSVLRQAGARRESGGRISEWVGLHFSHAMNLKHGDIVVDLHRSLRNRPAYRIDEGRLWRTRESRTLFGTDFPVLSDDYALALLCLELAQDIEAGKARMKQFLDLWLFLHVLDASTDWGAFLARRAEENILGICQHVVALCLEAFAPAAPPTNLSSCLSSSLRAPRPSVSVWRLLAGKSLRNRAWFSSVYPGGRLGYFAWWAVTAPPRYLVRRSG